MLSDWDCFERARDGDEIAWKILYNKYYKLLLKITLLITGSVDTAKDLVQETFIKMINVKLKNRDGSFKSYITTTAYRLALKDKEYSKRNYGLDNVEMPDETSSPLETIIKTESDKIVVGLINSLPNNQRDILILRLYGEQSYEDIARLLKLPLGTVKSRIFYAVKLCRKKLTEKGITK